MMRSDNMPIAVIGMSCRFLGGVSSPEEFWQLLCGSSDAITQSLLNAGQLRLIAPEIAICQGE
nr:beta-ketoacyl synthase N-terminal-like domain-containing protein [Photorhabdus laumondii]